MLFPKNLELADVCVGPYRQTAERSRLHVNLARTAKACYQPFLTEEAGEHPAGHAYFQAHARFVCDQVAAVDDILAINFTLEDTAIRAEPDFTGPADLQAEESFPADEKNPHAYRFRVFERTPDDCSLS